MTDTDLFADLEQPYPGRRKPVNRGAKVEAPVEVLWDARPTYYRVKGVKREFFTISHLSKALGRSQQSIRAWEAQGLLPNSPYRSPRTVRPVAAGRSTKGRRLWTRAQITGILRLAEEHKVILNRGDPPTPAFAKAVAQLFEELLSEENT